MHSYKRFAFAGMIMIALGIVYRTTLADGSGSLGTVLVAVGGLFLIVGLSMKRKQEEKNMDAE